ncbi:MAG TPA: hypothetical protein VLA42_12800 [Verrucomicrobiae bacterium]|jgi:hypothetical protein|nr:hypothetical protein [Verrucomicrobiae bacterium]
MICHHYKHALLELAAAGVEPSPELRAQLQACSSCRSAFEHERSLLASIDSCLRSSANAEIPSAFIPTVRAQLQRESPAAPAAHITNPLFWLPAIAAAAIILFIFASQDHGVKSQPTAEQSATQRIESPVAAATTAASPSPATTAPITAAIEKRHASKGVIRPDKNPVPASSSAPEILVPPDQEILLARYADQFRRHHQSSATLLTEVAPDQTAPLQVPLIQIAELDVKPLADTQQDGQQDDLREK